MSPAPLAAPLVALLVCAYASGSEIYQDDTVRIVLHNEHHSRELVPPEMPPGCMYEGRRYTAGAAVSTREACLRCVCAHGALACRRRACAPLPDPAPPRCSVLHRRGVCCPELHCPDGVTVTELDGAARFEDTTDYTDVDTPAAVAHACVEGGTVYAAGSAMSSGTACEQCFCLGGARRCVRPQCLPPPAGCSARPAPGACCPLRYYCDHDTATPPGQTHPHDCQVEDSWVAEGERVGSAEAGANCSRCFCLRGSVVCQPLTCAPALLGCTPLLLPGQCCPHQYHCEHQRAKSEALSPKPQKHLHLPLDNGLQYARIDDRSFHSSKSTKYETSTKSTPTSSVTKKITSTAPATKKTSTTTNKVKRKTNEPSTIPRNATSGNIMSATSTTQKHTTTTKVATSTVKPENNQINENNALTVTTEQPETSVRVVINGTINCTTELSSNSIPVNISANNNTQYDKINMLSRLPYIATSEAEDHTFNPNDIITDKSVSGGFDENESFVINVTSSLRTNTSGSTLRPSISLVKTPISLGLSEALNITKKKKGDYDYDYSEPTLPPSLPNLKIIPFVAADAVVENETPAKETSTYPILEREDKFPVYYSDTGTKEILFNIRHDDTYMPIYNHDRLDSHYPSLTHEIDLTNPTYVSNHNINNDVTSPLHEYATFTAFDDNDSEAHKPITVKSPSTTSTFKLETPSVNLFSPPVETEGGFIPKGSENIDDYYNVYQSTPASSIPYLTTSMQLDTNIDKGECTSSDGRLVAEGDTISLTCSVCTCAWGDLHCSPRPCHTPLGCRRLPASRSLVDLCCGELICDNDGATKTTITEEKHKTMLNETKLVERNNTESNTKETTTVKNTTKIETQTLNSTTKNTFENISTTTENIIGTSTNESINIENATTLSPVPLTSKEKIISTTPITETTTNVLIDISNQTKNISQDYEYDEDEGFSLGSVLKLLLSDSYDTTTISPNKRKPVSVPTRPPTATTTSTTMIPLTSTRKFTAQASLPSFVPMPQHHMPPKKSQQQSPVNRIDHLVLGEATAIRKQTPRPSSEHFKPITTTVKAITGSRLTTRPTLTTKVWSSAAEEKMKDEHFIGQHMSTAYEVPRPTASSASPSASPSAGLGLLKLAGCNIYGRMYRVDRVIAELSSACQECRCTELGVQCRSLNC